MIFDKRGNLVPYELIPADLDTLEAVFVRSFPDSATRQRIFETLILYLTELKATLNTSLEVWINGSFTTQKHDPNDIDFVIFVDRRVAVTHQTTIYQFRQRRYEENSMTDGYFVETVPEEHPEHRLYQLDRQDWHRAFVFGRNGQKGYLQIML